MLSFHIIVILYFLTDDDDAFRQYQVHVITGDVLGAGTDADIFIIFIGSQNQSGKLPWKLNTITL